MEMGNLMNASLKALLNEQYKLVAELREENKKLKEWNNELIENHKKDIDVLCEENKKLKSDLAFERTMLDNVRAEYKSLQNVNKKLKEELSKLKEKYGDIDY